MTACQTKETGNADELATPLKEGDPETWLTGDKRTLRILTNEGTNSTYPPASNDLPFWAWFEEYTNVHIEWEVASTTGYMEIVSTRLAAGVELPDIIMVNTLRIGESAGENGLLVDLSEYWDTHFVNTKNYWESQGIDILSHISTYDGAIYALCGMCEPVEGHITLMYNTDWMEQLGAEIPTTLDEFTDLLYKMKAAGDLNGNGRDDEVILTGSSTELQSALGTAFGLEIYEGWDAFVADENGVVRDEYTSDEMRNYLTYINKLYEDRVLDPEICNMSTNIMSEKIASDRVGIFAYYSGFAISYGQLTTKGIEDPFAECYSLGVALASEYNNNEAYFVRRERALGSPTAITKECKDVELACRWLDTLNADPHVVNVRAFGIEGEDWVYDEAGKVELIYPTDGTARNIAAKGCGQLPIVHFQPKEQLLEDKAPYPWYLEQYEAIRQCKWISPSVVHTSFYSDEEEEIISNVASDVKGMYGEHRDKFTKGTLDIETEWDTYVANMKKMGLEDLVSAWQMIYDRTKAE